MTDSVQIPVFVLLSIGAAVSAGFVTLWKYILFLGRENRRLQDLLLAEREERIKILEGLRREVDRRISHGKPF